MLAELAENGYARLFTEAVARRAAVDKAAPHRRWPSKIDMIVAVLAGFSVGLAPTPDTRFPCAATSGRPSSSSPR